MIYGEEIMDEVKKWYAIFRNGMLCNIADSEETAKESMDSLYSYSGTTSQVVFSTIPELKVAIMEAFVLSV